jgi:putative transposase
LIGETARQWYFDALSKACFDHDYALWAYVIMPEHVQLVVKPSQETYDVSKVQETVKKSVVLKAHNSRRKSSKPDEFWERFYDVQPNGERHFRFWQRGGAYDENIWSLEALRTEVMAQRD